MSENEIISDQPSTDTSETAPSESFAENTPEPPQQTSVPQSGRSAFGNWEALTVVALLLIVLMGGYFRFVGLNWDAYTHLHPDERFLTIVTSKLETVSDPLLYLRTSESPLNPYNKGEGFYVYGNFPMTVTRYIAEWAESLRSFCAADSEALLCQNNLTGYDGVHLIGRILSAVTDLVSIVFTFLIGRRLYGKRVGLIAAFLMATAVMPIQQSHFYTMDNWAAALATMTMYAAVRASEDGQKKRWWILFGIGLGITVASRINVAPLALMAGVSAIIWLVRQYQATPTKLTIWRYIFTDKGSLEFQYALLGVMIAALVSLFVFRVAQPYAFSDRAQAIASYTAETGQEPGAIRTFLQSTIGLNPQWRGNMEEIQRLQAPEAMFPPALQWVDRTAILFPLTNMLLYGMGLFAGIAAWVGACWALWRIAKARPDWLVHALPVAWIMLYFLFSATRWVKSIRYFLPIYPMLFIMAGWLFLFLWQKAQNKGWQRGLVATAAVFTLLSNFLWANAFVEIYRQPMTRVAASEWMFENIPSGATLLYETAEGEEKQLQLPLMDFVFAPGQPPFPLTIELKEEALVQGIQLNYVTSESGAAGNATLQVGINGAFGETNTTQGAVTADLTGERQPFMIDLPAARLEPARHQIYISSSAASIPFRTSTSVITSEHWDDALPSRIGGRDPYSQYFRGLSIGSMPTTHPDSDEKRFDMYRWLDEADYIVLSSQRSLWSLPRLPLTYPLMIQYYESLFSGELGFELVAEFHGDINIGPLYISDTAGEVGWGAPPEIGWPPPGDLAAEEAFSVYDHPPVWVFQKTDDFSTEKVMAVLGSVDLSNIVVMNPLEATGAPNAMQLTAEQQAIQQSNGTFSTIFNPDGVLSNNSFVAAAVWWLTVIALGWLTFPICFVVFSGLSDKGYALSRILSLLLLSYFAWFTASLNWLTHSRSTLMLALVIIAIVSALLVARHGRELISFVQNNWKLLAIMEGWALFLYLFQIVIRLGNPDAWHVIWGGEKPMDMSYFTAVLKSTTFPPYDPWFAGGYLNYYYYGFVYVGAITKLLGVVPTMAYNLILPMLYSFTGLGAFSLAYNLVDGSKIGERLDALKAYSHRQRALAAGFIATIFAVVLGNLAQVGVVFTAWERASTLPADSHIVMRALDGGWRLLSGAAVSPLYPGDWFWTATRAITIEQGEVAPITEFPFFTFLYGDLHAHMISLPLTILALGWALSVGFESQQDRQRSWWSTAGQWVIGGLAIGVLYPTNSWDYPTYLVIGAFAILFFQWQKGGLTLPSIGQGLLKIVALFAISLLAFWPFWNNFGTGYNSISLWEGSYTTPGNYLTIYGLFLLILVPFLAHEFRAWASSWTPEMLQKRLPIVIGSVVALYGLAFALVWTLGRGYAIAPLVLPLILLSGSLALWSNTSPARRITHVLIASSLGLTLFVEIFVLDGDIGRMNTVFKFYMQVWVMFSVACGAALMWMWPEINFEWGSARRNVWRTAMVALVFAALLYPLLATRAKWVIRMDNGDQARATLDGLDFMRYVTYGDSGQEVPLNYDYEAILWMHRSIEGSPVIAEAHSGNPYRSIGNRIAMYTGLPAIVGWDWHQRQQRTTTPGWMVSSRITDVNRLYNTADSTEAMTIINQYGVEYIYVGQLEWVYYTPQGLNKFDQMVEQGLLTEVYRNEGTSIYQVIGSGGTETAAVGDGS